MRQEQAPESVTGKPWPKALPGRLALGTQHSALSCHNRLLKICHGGGDSRPSGGERSMTGRDPGRCLLLRWIETCLPQRATNAGHFSDPNYRPGAGLKAKGMLLAIRKCGPPLPTHVCTWKENRWFFMFQEDVCSEDVPILLKLCLAPSKKKYSFLGLFFFHFLIFPHGEWVNWRDKSKLVTGCKRAHGQQTPKGMG